jgi:hypothetical protein
MANSSIGRRFSSVEASNDRWQGILREWVCKRAGKELDAADVDTLACDPPIPFFVRYEAFHEAEGKHLGILGSIIVADVFYGIFERDKIAGTKNSGTVKDQLTELSRLTFEKSDVLAHLSDPSWLGEFIPLFNMNDIQAGGALSLK